MQVQKFMGVMVERYPDTHFDFHAHNDYDLAVSNVYAAVLAGAKGLHTTINGLGERAGNAPLASVQAILRDHFGGLDPRLWRPRDEPSYERFTQALYRATQAYSGGTYC
jgi:isopropylmalate/homocitrate/citramalate synthase